MMKSYRYTSPPTRQKTPSPGVMGLFNTIATQEGYRPLGIEGTTLYDTMFVGDGLEEETPVPKI